MWAKPASRVRIPPAPPRSEERRALVARFVFSICDRIYRLSRSDAVSGGAVRSGTMTEGHPKPGGLFCAQHGRTLLHQHYSPFGSYGTNECLLYIGECSS